MALAKLANAPAPHVDKGPSCAVCRALEVLPKAEADGLVALMSNQQWSFKAIAEHIGRDEDYKPGGKLAEFSWVRDIAGATYGRHASAGCSARVRLRPRR